MDTEFVVSDRPSWNFASDNTAPVHPTILKALERTNQGHVGAYGNDDETRLAQEAFKNLFGPQSEAFLVFNGTGANVLGLSALVRPYQSIVCSENSHIQNDECGAPEKFSGSKLILVPPKKGKLDPGLIEPFLMGVGDQHHSQPKVISISQTTEWGTVYSAEEIRVLAQFAHDRKMLLHVDGARISNAVAATGLTLKALITDTGVDLLSFGGTKNGLLCAEAVVFLTPGLSENFKFIRKQGMQLASKMRFSAVQFNAFFENDLWLQNSRHANAMAKKLEQGLAGIDGVRVTQPVDANAVFASLSPDAISRLEKHYVFYVWNPKTSEVRWMTSFDTTSEDIEKFLKQIRIALQ